MKTTTTSPKPPDARTTVRFTLPYLPAQEVFLAGSFNEWDPRGLRLDEDESVGWTAQVDLPPGRHEYLFIVDGRWMADPNNPVTAPNPFGGCNSVVNIASKDPLPTPKRRSRKPNP